MGLLDFLTPASSNRVALIEEELVLLKERKRMLDEERTKAIFVPTKAEQNILDNLHPHFAKSLLGTLTTATKEGLFVILFQGWRSWELQASLYSQGRDYAGNIVDIQKVVTRSKPGRSWHQYKLAGDTVMSLGARPEYKLTWKDDIDNNKDGKNDWNQLGEIGKSFGLEWGGDFKTLVDKPHFQWRGGLDIDDAIVLYQKGGLDEVWKHLQI